MLLYYTLIDFDNGDSSTKYAHMFYDLQNPAADVFSASLVASSGDRMEESVEFEISTYQAGNASQLFAEVDYSNTLHLYVDTGVSGEPFVDNPGYDDATPAQISNAVPGPGSIWLLAAASVCLAAFRMRARFTAVCGRGRCLL